MCASGSITTRFDDEFECFICSSCAADHQNATNTIMLGREDGHVSSFEEPSTILVGKLYLGPHQSAVSKEFFDQKKIETVIVCCSHLPLYYATSKISGDSSKTSEEDSVANSTVDPHIPDVLSAEFSPPPSSVISSAPSSSSLRYYRIPLNDTVTEILLPEILQTIYDIIYKETEVYGRAVLIHCHQGVSRSATITIAYLMKRLSWNYEQAYAYVKERRPCIYPNKGFVKQLKEKWK
jgi:hypothetical protein